MDIPQLFIHSPFDGYSGCLQALDITNKVAVNIPDQVFVET